YRRSFQPYGAGAVDYRGTFYSHRHSSHSLHLVPHQRARSNQERASSLTSLFCSQTQESHEPDWMGSIDRLQEWGYSIAGQLRSQCHRKMWDITEVAVVSCGISLYTREVTLGEIRRQERLS